MSTDPLGDFFRQINHRLDLHKTVVSTSDTCVSMDVGDLYKQWIRDSHQRREVQLLQERIRLLRTESAKDSEARSPAPPTPEENQTESAPTLGDFPEQLAQLEGARAGAPNPLGAAGGGLTARGARILFGELHALHDAVAYLLARDAGRDRP